MRRHSPYLISLSLFGFACHEATTIDEGITLDASVVVEEHVDPRTGIPISTYRIPGANLHGGYFARSLFLDDETFYALSDHDGGHDIYLLREGMLESVGELEGMDVYEDAHSFGLTPTLSDHWLFYSDGTKLYRVPRGVSRDDGALPETFTAPTGERLFAPLYTTRDGRYVSVTITRESEPGVNYIARIDFNTGDVRYFRSPVLGTENPFVDHAQIHPFDPDRILFAREGSWVLDRVWLWNLETDTAAPMWNHPPFTEAGHEKWTEDGSEIYLVQYGQPARGIPSSPNFIQGQDQISTMGVSEEYYLAHAALRPDGRYFVADTYRADDEGLLWLVVYDVEAGIYHRVTPIDIGAHPAHPHPVWSPNGERFQWTACEEDQLVIREAALADVLATG